MNELSTLIDSNAVKELEAAFLEIQQPRTDFALEHFVAGQHDTEPAQYSQVVLELQIKYQNIRRAILNRKKIELKIKRLEEKNTEVSKINADLAKIDLEDQNYAMLGAVREFQALYRIWKGFGRTYTRDELNAAQEEYWRKRLTRQAKQDIVATGKIGQGNQDALRQIGLMPEIKLSHVEDVERRYLAVGNTKILVVIPTEKKAEKLPCIENLEIPSGCQVKFYNVWGRKVADAYNHAAETLLTDGADFLFTVEDDTFPPKEALTVLYKKYLESSSKTIVGAWYPKRTKTREGTPIVIKDGKRQALDADGQIHEVYTIPMGCTLFPKEAFVDVQSPWFATTDSLSQDSFFSQKAREVGYKLLCDTSIRCMHKDRYTGEEFT